MNGLLINALSLSLIIAPAILCGLWVHRRLRQRSASVWTLSTAMGISLTGMGAMMGLLSGESYLIGFSLVLGVTSGIGFGLWMIDNPELWRGIGISSLEPACLQGDVLLGKRSIRSSRVLSVGIYFLVVIFGYWIGRAILLHEPFVANFPGQLWIIPVSLLLAISLLFSKNRRRQ